MYGLSAKTSGRCREVTVVGWFKQESLYGLGAKTSGRCREVAVVGWFKQESMYGLSAQKKVTIVERWPL